MDRTVPAQRWIINLPCDMLFFIGIPLLSLAALVAAANYYASVDIAWSVVFLSSDRARQLTGQVLSVSGGFQMPR